MRTCITYIKQSKSLDESPELEESPGGGGGGGRGGGVESRIIFNYMTSLFITRDYVRCTEIGKGLEVPCDDLLD